MTQQRLDTPHHEVEDNKENKRHKDVVHLAPREIGKALVELKKDARDEVVHGQAEGLQSVIQVRRQVVKEFMVNVVHHDEHDAQALHEIDVSNALARHLVSRK